MTGAVLTGSLVILVLSLGFYGWPAILTAAAVGFLASWPVAFLISRWIKRSDPQWDESRKEQAGVIPDPQAPEV
jgi:hypothetical protein